MKRILILLPLVLVGGIVWRLMPLRIVVPPAPSPPRQLVLQGLTSTIEIPVAVGLGQLEAFLEEEIPKSKSEFMLNLLSGYKIKRGPIKVSSGKTGVTISSHVEGKGTAAVWLDVEVDGDFAVAVRPTIDKDWEPNLHVAVDADIDTAKINIRFAPDIHFRGKAEDEIEDFGERQAHRLNHKFEKKLALKDRAADYWHRVHTNIQLRANPPVWLTLDPVSASMRPLDYKTKHTVRSEVGLSLNAALYVGSNPPPVHAESLPPLKRDQTPVNGFKIFLPAIVELSELEKALERRLATNVISIPGIGAIKMSHLTLGHDGEQLKVGVQISTSPSWWHRPAKVNVELDGTPVLDERKQQLRLENVNFSARTKEAFLSGAAWLLQPMIASELEGMAVIPLPEHLRDLKRTAQSELDQLNFRKWLSGSVTLDSISIYRIALTERQLIVVLEAIGKAEVAGITFRH